jgi:hypothetical protein
MSTLIELHNVKGLTVTPSDDPTKRDILINETGEWFQIFIPEPTANLLAHMAPDSTHWIFYGEGRASIVKIECPLDDFIPISRSITKLIRVHDNDIHVVLIPISVVDVNEDKTRARVYAPLKAETWQLESLPEENWHLNVKVIKD